MNRVVVTGVGAVTPLGLDVPTFWRRLIAGERGLARLTRFDPTGLLNETAGQVWDFTFDPAAFGLASAPDLATQFLLQATREALADADLPTGPSQPAIGAVLSTNFGGGLSWESYCASTLAGSPNTDFAEFEFQSALGHLSQVFGLTGPMSLLSIACASGAASIGYAFDLIRSGKAQAMVAGGHDALAPTPLSGLSVLRTMTPEDIRPFSADRSGTLFGEGAAMLVLETLDHARQRGATICGEVMGSWQNNNAYHLTAPDKGGAGMARVLAGALSDAALPPDKLDYINAHGTGTKPHDSAETAAIKHVLGSHAYEIPVSSIKGATAHLMGAAGALEAIATLKVVQMGVVPPTVNYREPDPECDLDCVPNQAREAVVRYAATISAGVGGSNACVVFGPPPQPSEGDGALSPHPASSTVGGASSPDRAGREGGGRGWKPLPREEKAAVAPQDCRVRRTAHDHDVLITGLAPISAIGIGREDFAAGLREGREGRRAPERLTEHSLPLLAECLDFVVEDYLGSEKTYLDRCSELTLAACALAWQDAGLDWRDLNHPRVGLCLGTAFGCLDSLQNMTARVQTKGVRFGSPVIFTHAFANSPTSLAAVEYNLQGPTSTFCVGDVSAASALDYAWRVIADGRADVILAGGVDALSVALLAYLGLEPPQYVPGEGACLFVLESAEHASARGAQPLAQVTDVSLQKSPTASSPAVPAAYGHAFGASMALDLAAALLTDGAPEFAVAGSDPVGLAATVAVRRR